LDGEPVITCDQLDALIASRIASESALVRDCAEAEHGLIMASRGDPEQPGGELPPGGGRLPPGPGLDAGGFST
jgi:hypothetical protein